MYTCENFPLGALQAAGSLIITDTYAVGVEGSEGEDGDDGLVVVVVVVGLVGDVGVLGGVVTGLLLAPAPKGAPPEHPKVNTQANISNAAHAGGSEVRIGSPITSTEIVWCTFNCTHHAKINFSDSDTTKSFEMFS